MCVSVSPGSQADGFVVNDCPGGIYDCIGVIYDFIGGYMTL